MEGSYSEKSMKPLREPSGWLAFLLVRLIIGAWRGIILLITVLPLAASSVYFLDNPTRLTVFISFVALVGTVILIFIDVILYFYKKKLFIPLYIVTVGVLGAVYFLGSTPLYGFVVVMIESFFVTYLLTSKKVALRFGFFNKINRAALEAYAVRRKMTEQTDAVFEELEDAGYRYRRGMMDEQEFTEIKRRLLQQI